MGIESLIPLGISAVSSLAKGIGGGGGQQQAPQQQAMPANPFPMNIPDGGRRGASMLDAYGPASLAPVMPGAMSDQDRSFLGAQQPLSILDLLRQGGGMPGAMSDQDRSFLTRGY